ncbi:MAG: hypothetical protein ACYC0W_10555 [Candidatus Nanopelagicales bacterium]
MILLDVLARSSAARASHWDHVHPVLRGRDDRVRALRASFHAHAIAVPPGRVDGTLTRLVLAIWWAIGLVLAVVSFRWAPRGPG